MALAFLIGAYLIADAIMFVNGYKSAIFFAKTPLERKVREKFFKDRGIEWTPEEEHPAGWFARTFKKAKK